MKKEVSFFLSPSATPFLPGCIALLITLQVHRLVAALGSDPHISADGHQDGGIRLVCRSAGWHPEPEVQWRDHRGQPLPKTSEKISADTEGLFHVEVAVVIMEVSNQIVTCSVGSLILTQEKTASISIAGHFFPRVSPWMVALAVIIPIVLVVIVLGSFYFRRAKEKYKAVEVKYKAVEEKYKAVEEKYKAVEARYKTVGELGLTKAQRHAADVTLDPGTAHPHLVLSEDRKCVTRGNTRRDVPNTPERFDTCVCVLGVEGIAGGRRYWEVEVGDKRDWELGVCRESVRRKGWVTYTPGNGYWVVQLWAGRYEALTSPPTRLPVSVRPRWVGVFLDYEGGEVSFYNMTDRSHLFTFTDSFSGTLRPYFHPGVNAGGTNAAPLTLCPAPAQP